MQRRLTLALVGLALATIVLVGAGVLGFAQIGADRKARQIVEDRLAVLVDLASSQENIDRAAPSLFRLAETFGAGTVHFGSIDDAGQVQYVARRGEPDNRVGFRVTSDGIDKLATGGPFISRDRGTIRGVQILQLPGARGEVVAVVEQNVAAIGSQARTWFVLSAGIVLVGAILVAAWLARRFTAPIRMATATTTAIADGDFAARMPVEGNDELTALGDSINQMASELERGRAAEQQFLLSISHDLRTPLTAIGGYAEALRDGTATDTERVGSILQNHAGRLERLVQDLLDLAKLESRQFRLQLEPVDVSAVAEFVLDGSIPQATTDGVDIHLRSAGPAWIEADPDRLAQVIGNLIENAGKYATRSIEVGVDSDGHEIVVTVTDDGPGIPVEDLPHVFERLYVTQQRPRRAESSSGLGLAIVRELTQAMGGAVRAHSTMGNGTVMEVRFARTTQSAAVTSPVSL